MGLAAKGMVLAFVVFTALNVEFANGIYSAIRGWIETALNWYYISVLVITLFVCFYLMFSRFGQIRLGSDDSRPEFSNFSWFAMLFSAGVGIGILFFGIAEPMFYFDNTQPWKYPNNPFADLAGHTAMNEQRAVAAMRVTYFHWGLHAWSSRDRRPVPGHFGQRWELYLCGIYPWLLLGFGDCRSVGYGST